MEHLMFVRKCQAVLKKVWSCSEQILQAWAYSNLQPWRRNTSPAVWSLCFSQKSELVDYLAWVHVQLYDSFYFSTQKSKFLNKYQIFLRELDENSWKLDVQISDHRVSCSFLSCFFSLLSFLWKHLQTAMRYGHTPFKSPFIFHSASILCISHVFIFFYIIFSWIFLEFWNWITSFVC